MMLIHKLTFQVLTPQQPAYHCKSGLSVPPLLIWFVRPPLYKSGLSIHRFHIFSVPPSSIVIKLHGFSLSVHMSVTFLSPPLCFVRLCFCPHPFVCSYVLLSPPFCLFLCASFPTHLFVSMCFSPHPFVCFHLLLFPPLRDERGAKPPS